MSSSVSVIVPATTANIGPGFDCLGAALSLYNQFDFQVLDASAPRLTIQAEGQEADLVSIDSDNLVYQSFLKVYDKIQREVPNIAIKINLNVPLSRGLGSSATAIIGGLVGANAIAGSPLSDAEILDIAIAIEGHPDNVAPALLGNCQLSTRRSDHSTIFCPVPWSADLVPVVAIPDFELSTHEARSVLPPHCSYGDAIFNASHLALMMKALELGNEDWLKGALDDRLHQPYRTRLIKGYGAVREAALVAGAYGLVISGAGPTLLALCSQSMAEPVAMAMKKAWRKEGVEAVVQALSLDLYGTQVTSTEQHAFV
ncbi:MAG: homoserine kinase [Acaryochloridaceae cyanobacterium RL_2_7]|nr:homoserine kinase [Acaryochloridaceae cyanobacterium RL_2_7]